MITAFIEKKVLALSPGEYGDILKNIYRYGKQQYQWKVTVLSNTQDEKAYSSIIDSSDDIMLFPDYLRAQAWEKTPTECEAVDRFIHECEKTACLSANRLLLSFERELGRAYSKTNYYWPETKIAKKVLKDKALASLILRRLFVFARDVLQGRHIDFCLGGAPGPLNIVFYMVAKQLQIPCVFGLLSNIDSNRHFWTTDVLAFNQKLEACYREKLAKKEKMSAFAEDYLHKFNQSPEPQPIYKKIWKNSGHHFRLSHIGYVVLLRIYSRGLAYLKGIKSVKHKPIGSYLKSLLQTYVLFHRQKKFYQSFSEKKLSEQKYFYYACSQEPEFVLNTRAPYWYDQCNVIKLLSHSLPFGYQLIVREHRHNIGRRSTRQLKHLIRLPNVVLVDAFEDPYPYIRQANAVVTINGTIGFEALLYQKPTLTLSQSFYDSLATKKITLEKDLSAALLKLITQPIKNSHEELGLFIDADQETTLSCEEKPEKEMEYIYSLIQSKKILAIIPARGGSKRLPEKNIKMLNGRPMIDWTILAAQQAKCLTHVVVNSDDENILRRAVELGCDALRRPAELALDETPSSAVVLQTLDHYPGYDYLILLQPTSPLRRAEDIDLFAKKWLSSSFPASVSVTEGVVNAHCFSRDGNGKLLQAGQGDDCSLNGAIYGASVEWFRQQQNFISAETLAYDMPASRSIDVDTLDDFIQAETLLMENN